MGLEAAPLRSYTEPGQTSLASASMYAPVSFQSIGSVITNSNTLTNTAPDGTAWDSTDLNAVRLRLKRTAGTSDNIGASEAHVEIPISTALPPTPANLSDRNGDGFLTFCKDSDSVFTDRIFEDQVLLDNPQLDTVINCSHGGKVSEDLIADLDDILDTGGQSTPACTLMKGTQKRKCDFFAFNIGANNYHANPSLDATSGKCAANAPNAGATCHTKTTFSRASGDVNALIDRVCTSGTRAGLECFIDPSTGVIKTTKSASAPMPSGTRPSRP